MKPLDACRLYTFVDTAYLAGRQPAEVAQQLCDGGSDLIQLRAKTSTPDEIRRMAEVILPITEAAGVGLVINDHPVVALEVGAEFCHLGQEDFFDKGYNHVSEIPGQAAIKSVPPVSLQIGLSSHAPEQAERAVAAGASYVAIGPVYATQTKPLAKPVTLEYVQWASRHLHVPWFAIGGINRHTIDAVVEAGAKRVCIVSAILSAVDIAKACQMFKERLSSAP